MDHIAVIPAPDPDERLRPFVFESMPPGTDSEGERDPGSTGALVFYRRGEIDPSQSLLGVDFWNLAFGGDPDLYAVRRLLVHIPSDSDVWALVDAIRPAIETYADDSVALLAWCQEHVDQYGST